MCIRDSYGTAKRTSFQIYRMKALDWTLLAVMLTLAGVAAVAAAMGGAAAELTPKLAIQPVTGIYGVASVMESVLHVAVPADAPINSFKDIVDQKYPIKVSVGAQGSGIESLFRKVLAYYGASYNDIAAWGGKVEYLNIGDASTLFTDGQLNAVSVLAGMPYSTISEIAASKDIKLLTLEQEAVDALSSQGYLAKTIPAGTYTGCLLYTSDAADD